ncbi:MAG: hypothetical protein ABR511_08540, partial [Acidimicrobiales bacterium]
AAPAARCGCHAVPHAMPTAVPTAVPTGVPTGVLGTRPRPAPRPAPAVLRRRRFGAVLLVASGAVAAWVLLGMPGGALTASGHPVPSPPSAPAPTTVTGPPAAGSAVVEVGPGDTLWTLARRLQPEGDVRPLVDHLVAVHGGAVLRVGERIALPAS